MKEMRVYNGDRVEGIYLKNEMLDKGWKVEAEERLEEEKCQIIFTRESTSTTSHLNDA